MNHAITVGGLINFLTIIAGVGMMGIGAIAIFAGGMSDAPLSGAETTKHGCVIAGIGALLIAVCIAGMILS